MSSHRGRHRNVDMFTKAFSDVPYDNGSLDVAFSDRVMIHVTTPPYEEKMRMC
jgi:hypothetical protein